MKLVKLGDKTVNLENLTHAHRSDNSIGLHFIGGAMVGFQDEEAKIIMEYLDNNSVELPIDPGTFEQPETPSSFRTY